MVTHTHSLSLLLWKLDRLSLDQSASLPMTLDAPQQFPGSPSSWTQQRGAIRSSRWPYLEDQHNCKQVHLCPSLRYSHHPKTYGAQTVTGTGQNRFNGLNHNLKIRLLYSCFFFIAFILHKFHKCQHHSRKLNLRTTIINILNIVTELFLRENTFPWNRRFVK